MERILSRPILQVCTRCYKDFLSIRNAAPLTFASHPNRGYSSSRATTTTVTGHYFLERLKLYSPSDQSIHIGRPVLGNETPIRCLATDAPQPSSNLPPKSKGNKDAQKSPITWKTLIIIGSLAGALLLGMKYVKGEKEEARRKAQNKKMGKAKLGGDWTLTDHHGKVRSSKEFRGQWILIYFGFTNCPDVCPEEMDKIVSVIQKTDADPDVPTILPIMITVDPDRDTPEALKEYLAEFSPRLLGFSGTRDEIDVATRAFRVYYSSGPKDEDNDYIVDHSIISYLVNPEGEFAEYFGQNKKVEEIYNMIKLQLRSYQKKKAS